MDVARIHKLNDKPVKSGPVIYWMSSDQRVRDNSALIHAAFKAAQAGAPLVVIFCLVPTFQGAGWRHYAFMLQGLRELEESLAGPSLSLGIFCLDIWELQALGITYWLIERKT